MIIWGINAQNHDASISVIDTKTNEILFAGHAERYSRQKNDFDLNSDLLSDALKFGNPDVSIWHENPWKRRMRYLAAGQFKLALTETLPSRYLRSFGINSPLKYSSSHHYSHAAGGYFTSGFSSAAVLIIDAVGEMDTATIWDAEGSKITKVWGMRYPNSIGLFYSAITQCVGLKPNEEEYILMGMAAYGVVDEKIKQYLLSNYFSKNQLDQKFNFHLGIYGDDFLEEVVKTEQGKYNLAACAQSIVEQQIDVLIKLSKKMTGRTNLVYSGGVALNCVANTKSCGVFDKMWIMPNPGDAGNSLGAAAGYLKKQLKWTGAFLGHDIDRPLDVDGIINELLTTGICGVANGMAEFGPRALGNRSLIADPRRSDIKDKVNEIKRRQKFRPFAPAILEEFAHEYFEMPTNAKTARYMQYVVRTLIDDLPAVKHFDGSARVQTVDPIEAKNLHTILSAWNARTGCPVLLNTSLNIKGEPLVNTWEDAVRWQNMYDVRVF